MLLLLPGMMGQAHQVGRSEEEVYLPVGLPVHGLQPKMHNNQNTGFTLL